MIWNSIKTKDDNLAGLIAVFIPLIQVVGYTFSSINASFSFHTLFVNPDFLPIVNALSIPVIIGGIGLLWVWKKNYIQIALGGRPIGPNMTFPNTERALFATFLGLSFLALVSVISFIVSVATPLDSIYQYISYFLSLVFGGLVIYLAIQEYIAKINLERNFDLVANLPATLRSFGTVTEPQIQIHTNEEVLNQNGQVNSMKRRLEVTIGGRRLELFVRSDGKEIYSERDITPQGVNQLPQERGGEVRVYSKLLSK